MKTWRPLTDREASAIGTLVEAAMHRGWSVSEACERANLAVKALEWPPGTVGIPDTVDRRAA